jgi:sphingomyelin phosphodiesterase acid-like 3
LPAHYKCDTTCYLSGKKLQKHNAELSTALTDLRNITSRYKVPLYYVPGNNDGLAGDYYSFANSNQQTLFSLAQDSTNPYPALNISASKTHTPYIMSMPDPSLGYYSVLAILGLRIVVLNSVILGNKYEANDGVPQLDAGNEEMKWLSEQLKDAKAKDEKVYIAMHIPPGVDAYKFSHGKTPNTTWAILPSANDSWLKQFLSLAYTYQTSIAGIFYGHTHMDELRVLYDSTGNLMEVAISAPGITPLHGNNPGFKTVSFDPVSMAPTDFTTYYTTLPAAKIWGNATYSFSDIFNNKAGNTIYNYMGLHTLNEIDSNMNRIYTVMHGYPLYKTNGGIVIK